MHILISVCVLIDAEYAVLIIIAVRSNAPYCFQAECLKSRRAPVKKNDN